MTENLSVSGLVATEPRHIVTSEGLAITSFRLAALQRKFDREIGQWREDGTNWYTVSAFRGLATNVASSVSKGQRVLVSGRLKVRDWDTGERSGISVDIEADAIGHDLTFGTTTFERNRLPEAPSREEDTEATADTDSEEDTF
jgi:single-strand DNA-binding protein